MKTQRIYLLLLMVMVNTCHAMDQRKHNPITEPSTYEMDPVDGRSTGIIHFQKQPHNRAEPNDTTPAWRIFIRSNKNWRLTTVCLFFAVYVGVIMNSWQLRRLRDDTSDDHAEILAAIAVLRNVTLGT